MPSGDPPRPAFGQVWAWEEIDYKYMLLRPVEGEYRRQTGTWLVLSLYIGDPWIGEMAGFYSDRPTMAGWTFIEGAEK